MMSEFLTKGNDCKEFINQAKSAREDRLTSHIKTQSACKLQALVRGFLCRRCLMAESQRNLEKIISGNSGEAVELASNVYELLQRFLFHHNTLKNRKYSNLLHHLSKYLLMSMQQDCIKNQYASLALSKNHILGWIRQLKCILVHVCTHLTLLKPESSHDMKIISTFIALALTFTNSASWKIYQHKQGEPIRESLNKLCTNILSYLHSFGLYQQLQTVLVGGLARTKSCLSSTAISAILALALRAFCLLEQSVAFVTDFIVHILSVPALIHHVCLHSQDSLVAIMQSQAFNKSIDVLVDSQSNKIVFNSLEGNYSLCLLANLAQLAQTEMQGLVERTSLFVKAITLLLCQCRLYVLNKKSNLTHWHPVLGWFSQHTDENLYNAMPLVMEQLKTLWSMKTVEILFEPLFSQNEIVQIEREKLNHQAGGSQSKKDKQKSSKWRKKAGAVPLRLSGQMMTRTCDACILYLSCLETLSQLRLDILSGLCWHNRLLGPLWDLITNMGPQNGLRPLLDLLMSSPNDTGNQIFSLLHLACQATSHIMTILDDVELYEKETPFKLSRLVEKSLLLNQFVFLVIWEKLLNIKTAKSSQLFGTLHALLIQLYERDCRRQFAPDKHWLQRQAKMSCLNTDEGIFLLSIVPHVFPHSDRVMLFRKYVSMEKSALGLTAAPGNTVQSTLITIHRSRLFEDGYLHLANLKPNALKGIIRVRFVNEQGLDEPGIDQDGVFKEFLEETISRVFDPGLNLFKLSNEQKLYPSSTSFVQDNHLALFEFVGRMLGKTIYEGIVVDVPFANFFLSQLCGQIHSPTYSSIDELPSLDAELYKNLTYVKHFEGDIADLDLMFSFDEDVLGRIVTHELVTGGSTIPVTEQNKISYVHLMAHYRMRVQIREQTAAFLRGFKAVIDSEWLSMFSAPELQKLISGDNADINITDLRKNTQYYGGYHSSHRVVSWLWDILENNFTRGERALFLKFVTSCSKPPLLGFSYLEPSFSIRCVDVADDQDTGDTVASVLKGFFNIRKKENVGRLPTSSTCFNLLKLPNYSKKSTLREKLKYAINSNTGFELS